MQSMSEAIFSISQFEINSLLPNRLFAGKLFPSTLRSVRFHPAIAGFTHYMSCHRSSRKLVPQ
jgi:hypothetical protein